MEKLRGRLAVNNLRKEAGIFVQKIYTKAEQTPMPLEISYPPPTAPPSQKSIKGCNSQVSLTSPPPGQAENQERKIMKLLTLNFLTCARKTCKKSPLSFPLHPKDAELEALDVDFNALLLRNLLPRLEWDALVTICNELGLPGLPALKPEVEDLIETADAPAGDAGHTGEGEAMDVEGEGGRGDTVVEMEGKPSKLAREMHRLLLETSLKEGKLVCAACEHAYEVKEGIANFLLPAHMV
jgi:multifunctional methyltransferase subunit TRM112